MNALAAFLRWWSVHQPLVLLMLALIGGYNNYQQYKAIRDGKCSRDDFGYFWRAWRQGDPVGRRVMLLSLVAVAIGVCFTVSICMRLRVR